MGGMSNDHISCTRQWRLLKEKAGEIWEKAIVLRNILVEDLLDLRE